MTTPRPMKLVASVAMNGLNLSFATISPLTRPNASPELTAAAKTTHPETPW